MKRSVDRRCSLGPLSRGDDRKLDIARSVTGYIQAGHTSCFVLVGRYRIVIGELAAQLGGQFGPLPLVGQEEQGSALG